MARTLNQVVGGEKRRALVEAAFARIASDGLEGLRLRQVAEDVGIDHSTLHHHVATKRELILAVAAYTTRRLWTRAFDLPDPGEALHAYLAETEARLQEGPAVYVVRAELDLRALRDPAVAAALAELEGGWRVRLVELFERGLADGTWSDLDPVAASELVVAALKGLRHAPAQGRVVTDLLENLMHRKERPCTS